MGKKVPTLVIELPFSAVWSKKSGIWIPIMKISLHRFQSVPALATQVIKI
jgi:hypothetical protein